MDTQPGPPPRPRRQPLTKGGKVMLGIAAGAMLLLMGVCTAAVASHPDTQQGTPAAARAAAATPTTTLRNVLTTPPAAPKPSAAPGMTDAQVRQAVLSYKACPNQGDDLQRMPAYVFTLANDDPKGTDTIGRQGDIVRVAVSYDERGEGKRAIFDFHLSSRQVTGEDSVAQQTLGTLQDEC